MDINKIKRRLMQGEQKVEKKIIHTIERFEKHSPLPKGEDIKLNMKTHTIKKRWSGGELKMIGGLS